MIGSARAFLIAGLIALPTAALLHLFALLGMSRAWPAMVHLTLFGWITALIYAVNVHTMPVFSARDFPEPRLIWAQWSAWCAGVALATTATLAAWRGAEVAGLLLQLIAALLFLVNTILLFVSGPRRPHHPLPPPVANQPRVDGIGTQATKLAGLSLPLALLLLLAVRLGWISGSWLLAAEHLAALGWVMLMIVGVAYHVLPRFSGVGTRGPAWARTQLLCHVVALALMVAALGFAWIWAFAAGGMLMALALGLFAWTVWPTINRRLQIGHCRSERQGQSAIYNLQSAIPLEERSR
jgi:hypothetical protein